MNLDEKTKNSLLELVEASKAMTDGNLKTLAGILIYMTTTLEGIRGELERANELR